MIDFIKELLNFLSYVGGIIAAIATIIIVFSILRDVIFEDEEDDDSGLL